MIRLIYYAILAYIIYVIYKFFQNLGKKSAPPKSKPRLSGMMVRDEVCNTYVPKEEALREMIGGKECFFCSKECRNKFLDQAKNSP